MVRRFALLAAALFVVAASSWSAAGQDPSARVDKVFARIEENRGAALWDDVRDLRETGRDGLEALRQGLTRADANVRIAAGAAIYGADARDEGLAALLQVAKDSKQEGARPRAANAAAILVETDPKLAPEQREKLSNEFMEAARATDDDLVKIHLCRGAYALYGKLDARKPVRDLFEKTTRRDVKDEAALALASMEVFQATRSHLMEMAKQPGENGRLARAWLRYDTASLQRERAEGRRPAGGESYELLDEIVAKLREYYYDKKLIDRDKLIEAAARGMLSSLDPHTAYYDKKMIDDLKKEALEGHYGGIGARVMMRKNSAGVAWLTITEPIFSGPAYRAGLRSNDIISDVEGESTADRDQGELILKLRGKPGTPVKIKIFRRGWKEPREYEIKREEVQLETTMSDLLPGGIGYVNYTTFGDLADEEKLKGSNLESQIAALEEKGMKALVLDLRFNSGGYLRTARQIAGMFLKKDEVILTTMAQGKVVETHKADPERVRVKVPSDLPVVVLVNEFSASASEILAGALQHYKRAVLVGERTYGKGSVQDLKPLESKILKNEKGEPILDERGEPQFGAAARITIAKWYLPSGKTVEKEKVGDKEVGGVEPDIKVPMADRDLWKEFEFEKIRATGKIEDYLEKQFPKNKEVFEQLAVMDYGDPSKYPGYDEMFATLSTRCTKEEARELVREFVRKRVQDERKKAFYYDLETDVQLQRAILESCKALKVEAKTIKEYGYFAAAK
ncbi:MAG TPA: S41 family peptidase [Planctomycetota bacterium]|nr:S41 family peptidase [Planctomycetota bacterium]